MQQSEICCVCIRTNLELISIMETDPNTIKYSCKLNQCVPEVVWNEENRICEQCIEQLEAACAFRDLCLQSHTIRRQLLERIVAVQDFKTEEITIDDEDVLIKVETDPELISDSSSAQKLPSNESEFSNIDGYYTILVRDQDARNETTETSENETPNKSYLRDLLQTPQELLKIKNYTVDKSYSQYMKQMVDERSIRSSSGNTLATKSDILDDDDILYVETKENERVLDTTSHMQSFSQTTQPEIIHSLGQVEPQIAEETNEEDAQEKTNEKQSSQDAQTKAYNLHEDGIELVEVNVKSDISNKSLLRDLLLKPQEAQNIRNYPSENDDFQYVEVKGNNHTESKGSHTFNLSDPLQTNQESLKLKDCTPEENLCEESYFDNRLRRLPDTPRTEHYYQCKDCAVKFKDRRNLTKHNKDFHQFNRPWDCVYCTKSFKTQPELKQHEKSHLNQRKYECSVCCRSYNTTSVLAKHKIIKHKSPNEWRYLCPHCDQKYPFKAFRDQHIRRNHTNAGTEYICFHCNTGFSNKLLLIAHIRYKHNSENLMRQCHICQNTYINQAELEGHMLQRHNLETIKFPKKIKKYKCDKCSKLYTTLKAKNSHYDKCDGIRRHTSKKIEGVKLEWTPS